MQRFSQRRLWMSNPFIRTKEAKSSNKQWASSLAFIQSHHSYEPNAMCSYLPPFTINGTRGVTTTSTTTIKKVSGNIDENSTSILGNSSTASTVDDLAVICARAKEITHVAIQSMQLELFSNDSELKSPSQKDLQKAIYNANDLLSIATSLNTPFSSIPSYQYSTLHGSFLAVTMWLLQLLTTNLQNNSESLKYNTTNDEDTEHVRQCVQTIVELAEHASFLEVPLHLPLHNQLLNQCAEKLPVGMAAPVIFKLCSSLETSYPSFKDWETLLAPILKQKLEEATPEDIELVCQEMNKIIRVTQSELQWELSWESALDLLQSLKVKYDIQRKQQQYEEGTHMMEDKDQSIPNQDMTDVPSFEHTSESIQILSEPLQIMLKRKKRKLKELSQEIHDVLSVFLKNKEFNRMDISPAGLEQLLDLLFFHDEDDDKRDDGGAEDNESDNFENKDIPKSDDMVRNSDMARNLDSEGMKLEDAIALVRNIEQDNESVKNDLSTETDSIEMSHQTETSSLDALHKSNDVTKEGNVDHTRQALPSDTSQSYHHDMIYYRDESNLDWSLPDITAQCVEWNHNKALRFTKEYEEELIRQISEEEDDEEYYNDLAVFLTDEDDDDDLD